MELYFDVCVSTPNKIQRKKNKINLWKSSFQQQVKSNLLQRFGELIFSSDSTCLKYVCPLLQYENDFHVRFCMLTPQTEKLVEMNLVHDSRSLTHCFSHPGHKQALNDSFQSHRCYQKNVCNVTHAMSLCMLFFHNALPQHGNMKCMRRVFFLSCWFTANRNHHVKFNCYKPTEWKHANDKYGKIFHCANLQTDMPKKWWHRIWLTNRLE